MPRVAAGRAEVVGDEHLAVVARRSSPARSTGRAAACSRRSSDVQQPRVRQHRADIRSASAQPGRIGSGVTLRASSSAASTAFVVGRSTAAVIVRVAMSTMPVSSTVPATPSSRTDQHVQRGRVDLHHLARPGGRALAERRLRPLGQRPAGAGRPEVCRPLTAFTQPVERRPRRHRHRLRPVLRPPGSAPSASSSPVAVPVDRALLAQHLLQRLHHPLDRPGPCREDRRAAARSTSPSSPSPRSGGRMRVTRSDSDTAVPAAVSSAALACSRCRNDTPLPGRTPAAAGARRRVRRAARSAPPRCAAPTTGPCSPPVREPVQQPERRQASGPCRPCAVDQLEVLGGQ